MCNLKLMLWIYMLFLFMVLIVFLILEIFVIICKYMISIIYDDWKIYLLEIVDFNDCK